MKHFNFVFFIKVLVISFTTTNLCSVSGFFQENQNKREDIKEILNPLSLIGETEYQISSQSLPKERILEAIVVDQVKDEKDFTKKYQLKKTKEKENKEKIKFNGKIVLHNTTENTSKSPKTSLELSEQNESLTKEEKSSSNTGFIKFSILNSTTENKNSNVHNDESSKLSIGKSNVQLESDFIDSGSKNYKSSDQDQSFQNNKNIIPYESESVGLEPNYPSGIKNDNVSNYYDNDYYYDFAVSPCNCDSDSCFYKQTKYTERG